MLTGLTPDQSQIVRRNQDRGPPARDLHQEPGHLRRISLIQVPRGLIGKQDPGAAGQSPRDRHPLLLAARQLGWVGVMFVPQPNRLQMGPRASNRLSRRQAQFNCSHREDDVLEGGEAGQEAVILVNHCHPSPETGKVEVATLVQFMTADVSHPGGELQIAVDDTEQRGFSGTTHTCDERELTGSDLKSYVVQRISLPSPTADAS